MYMILQVHDIDYDHISFIFGKRSPNTVFAGF